jgi:glutamate/tyrosine decarboxylase-like PLP-dependent enzyme
MDQNEMPPKRSAPIEISAEEFRRLGYRTVDRIADLLGSLANRPVTPGESPKSIRQLLVPVSIPEQGCDPHRLLDETADLLLNHSLFNGHSRFLGFITSSAAPIGILGDLLAAAVNPNVGGWTLSPMASEIEAQTIRWIAEMIGYPISSGGVLVSGGNMANFIGFLAARKARANWDVRTTGAVSRDGRRPCVYVSKETHTWIQKAADLCGLGTDSIRWIAIDEQLRLDTNALRKAIQQDIDSKNLPFLVVGTAGTVSTGAIDPLAELAAICQEYNLWFHVDGAYGGFAAVLAERLLDLGALSQADSVAVDPHKWLYAPLEAGCALVRDPNHLHEAFTYHPPYYHHPEDPEEAPINYHEYGPQNSRGFRALKVWLALRQVGREGYRQMIHDDIRLAEELYRLAANHPELEAVTQGLSITTFRYVPPDLRTSSRSVEAYLNQLNTELLNRLQTGGEVFLSNAIVNDQFLLRACIVNFRTSLTDIRAIPDIVTRIGGAVDKEMRLGLR